MDVKERKRDKKRKSKQSQVEQKQEHKMQHKSKGSVESKMSENLKSSKFRFLNEKLYTTPSSSAVDLFKKEPNLFDDYHEGYRQQVEKWPKNPLDMLVSELKKVKYINAFVGDFGCGEGKLELQLKENGH